MDKIEEVLTRRVEKIYPSKEALEKVLRSGKKIRLYQGFDPSTPNLHLGHLVGLLKLKEFQQLGHEVIFLIGDFTGMIGDPTGKIKGARPQLSEKQVLKNAQTYKQQASMILNFSGKNPVKLLYNSHWLAKLSAIEAARLMRHLTYSQIIKRDMFQKRLKEGKDIFVSEFFYPFLQAYDSVHLDVDLEIGGSDQMFNMLVGRDLMKKLKGKEKFVMTTKLLLDSQGEKIGKTAGNAINLASPPKVLFGQIMNLTDDCILPCFELITNTPLEQLEQIKKALRKNKNPITYKKKLAFELIKMLHSEKEAQAAQEEFEKVFQKKKIPSQIPTTKTRVGESFTKLLVEAELVPSSSEAKRLLSQGAVDLAGTKIDLNSKIKKEDSGKVLKIGKRKFIQLQVNETK